MDEIAAVEGERFFRGDLSSVWRQLFAWLAARDGIRDDRTRVIESNAFVRVGDALGVHLDLRRAEREVPTLCTLDTVALRQLAGLLDLKWPVVQAVLARSAQALAVLVQESWDARVGPAPLRWRVVDSSVRAIVTADYVPVDDIALLRVLESPLTAAGLAPVRALRSPSETRIEFGSVTEHRGVSPRSSANRPGIVLRNSETGHASVALFPALVRHNGVATRLTEPSVEHRHVVADRDALANRLVAAVPVLLAAAADACARWAADRSRPCPPRRTERAFAAIERAFGKTLTAQVRSAFAARSPDQQTPSGLYAVVAAATRELSPRKRAEADPLLSALLETDVVSGVSPVQASTV